MVAQPMQNVQKKKQRNWHGALLALWSATLVVCGVPLDPSSLFSPLFLSSSLLFSSLAHLLFFFSPLNRLNFLFLNCRICQSDR